MKKYIILLSLLLSLYNCLAQKTQIPNKSFSGDYLLGPGDVIRISIYWGEAISADNNQVEDVEIRADGNFFLQLLGDVHAENMTTQQLEDSLFKKLHYIIKNPRVFVKITQFGSRRVTIFGEALSGVYPLKKNQRITQFLSSIGGVSNNADIANIRISRQNNEMVELNLYKFLKENDVSQNILLEPGDLILIPSVTESKVMVLGQVNSPGVIPVQNKISIVEALVKTGGGNPKANFKNIKIVRFKNGEKSIFTVNIYDIIKDKKQSTVYLKPGDLVYVPDKADVLEGMNKLLRTILPSLQTAILVHSVL